MGGGERDRETESDTESISATEEGTAGSVYFISVAQWVLWVAAVVGTD